jgi:shikimate dehydrogenase
MHNALFARFGLDGVYLAFDVHPDRAEQVASAIRTLDLVGVNLTVPFKERVVPLLDRRTQAVEEAGAANVVTNVDGWLTGYNTDGEGLVRSLEEECDWRPAGRRCLVLGAGGAGRAVAASLAAGGAARVCILNRTVARARRATEHLARFSPQVAFSAGALSAQVMAAEAPQTDLVVNALGGGARDAVASLDIGPLPRESLWVDINYWMADPPQTAACAARGVQFVNGMGMLIHQGALSFELFTGHPIEPAELRRILGARHLR